MRFFLILLLFVFSTDCFAQVQVKGYYRKDGTYVSPHIRSSPDAYKWNNYGPSSSSPEYLGKGHVTSPYTRDIDRDGIANLFDYDDNNDGIHDDATLPSLGKNTVEGIGVNNLNSNYTAPQMGIVKKGYEKIPAVVAYLLLKESRTYGHYTDESNGSVEFVEYHDSNGNTQLTNIQNNSKFQASGKWGGRDDSICYQYESDGGTQCYDVYLMPTGIVFFNVNAKDVITSTITKIENSEFTYDYETGNGFTTERLRRVKALLAKH